MTPAQVIAGRLSALPALDTSVARLARLINNPDSTIGAFENIIRPDPALTANLLKLANSAMHRGKSPVATVRDAITRVGTRRVWEVAAASAFGKVMPKVLKGYDIDAAAFWQHSMAVGVLSETIARSARIASVEDAFTAGLLHDMGKLVIENYLAKERTRLVDRLEQGNLSMVNAEREILGTDHAEVGEAVARKWGLPDGLGVATRWHHDPLGAPESAQQDLAGVVHIANGLAHAMGFGPDIAGLRRRIDPAVLKRFSFDPPKLERLAGTALAVILEMGRSLKSSGGAS